MFSRATRTVFWLTLAACSICPPLNAQTPATTTLAFEASEVHATPHTATPYMTGGMLHGVRYMLHNASMVDMIALAYNLDDDNIVGGPAWLDLDHFDVTARAPHGTSPDDTRLMLRTLLAERFHLVLHDTALPRPTYVLRVDKGGIKAKKADDNEDSHIDQHHPSPNAAPGVPTYYTVSSYNRNMHQLADMLHDFATGYLPKPVVDATGLSGGYDFDLAWTWKPEPGGLTIFQAVQQQLGLKLALEKYPTPVVMVDSVSEKPTPNAPGVEAALPPAPPAEFEVSVITPSKPGAQRNANIVGNQVTGTAITLKFLVTFAYNINPNDNDLIVNAPKFFDQDKWDVLAKAAPESQATGPDGKTQVDFDMLPHMVQTMLAERFNMKSHMEDRPLDAFTLVSTGPKMKKADPLNRAGCKEGPGPDGKDPRIETPILGRLLTCQNMTMAQFAEQIPTLASGFVFTPVLDATNLKDAYDFTISFSSAGQLHSAPPQANGQGNTADSDPNGGLSLQDAMAKQMGVKLEKQRRTVQVLVIDHIDEKPTDN